MLYLRLSPSLRATIKTLRRRMGVTYPSQVIAAAIRRALAEMERSKGELLVPMTGEPGEGCTYKVEPELIERLNAAARASRIERYHIVRAGLKLLAREHEAVDPSQPGGGDQA